MRNEDNARYGTPGGNDTEDRVFLLSVREAEEWLSKIERRNGDWWWLRSSGDFPNYAAIVNNAGGFSGDGGIYGYGYFVNNSINAVCPALWIDPESEIE